MTARYSYDIDEQSIGAYLKDIVDQVNDEQSTDILSSKHYDPQSYVSILKQLVTVVNDNYSGDDIPIGDYDHTLVAEIIRRVTDKVANGGGGGDYVAKAVHFDNSTPDSVFLHTNSLIAAADVGVFSGVLWVKTADESGAPTIFVADPENSYGNYAFLDSGSTPVDEFFTHWKSTDGAQQFAAVSSVGLGDDNWHSVIFTVKTDLSLGTKIRKVYVDRVQCSDEEEEYDDTADAFTMTFNGLSFYLGSDGFGGSFTGDLADVRLMPGVSLLTGSDISGATLDLFATAGNKPVDPATATSALGLAGAVLFSGDADTFATNQGTGGAFTLTGSLTNATTSPSD